MIELDKIYNIDMLKGIADIPDESIDLVVKDCPYHVAGGGCSTGVYMNKKGVKQGNLSDAAKRSCKKRERYGVFEHTFRS